MSLAVERWGSSSLSQQRFMNHRDTLSHRSSIQKYDFRILTGPSSGILTKNAKRRKVRISNPPYSFILAGGIASLNPREVFCEVLNPKGKNIEMMRQALRDKYPSHCKRLSNYTLEYWAKFTFKVLRYGVHQMRQFIPWADTQQQWRKHLSEQQNQFLEAYLPPAVSQTDV